MHLGMAREVQAKVENALGVRFEIVTFGPDEALGVCTTGQVGHEHARLGIEHLKNEGRIWPVEFIRCLLRFDAGAARCHGQADVPLKRPCRREHAPSILHARSEVCHGRACKPVRGELFEQPRHRFN